MNKYQKYKPSGVDWISEIPDHWGLKKLKFNEVIIMGQSPKSDDYNAIEKGIPFLQGNADFGHLHPIPTVWCDTANKTTIKDDILLSVRAPIGAINIANQEYGIGRGLCAIRGQKTNSKFIYYQFTQLVDILNSIGTGSTYLAVSVEDIKNTLFIYPLIDEQTVIANFLDEKTAQIDALIAKKQQLIELLREERTAIINNAVTKGINPNVKLKPSGVEWLGNIAEHWDVVKFNHYIYLRHGFQFMSGDFTSEGIRVVKITQLKADGTLDISETSYIEAARLGEFKDIIINEGDVLMALTGGTIGNIIRVAEVKEPLVQNYRVGHFSPMNNKIKKDFMFWVLSSEIILNQIFFEQRETGQPNIGKENFNSMYIALPPPDEQSSIVKHVESQTQNIDRIIATIGKEIELMQEYRTALISEVVTGKVKVV